MTGSGKTAVYLHAALAAMPGGQALVLVPEIALAPQAADAFRRAGARVGALPQRAPARERADVWSGRRRGRARRRRGDALGGLLPFRSRGLRSIVVDEEQDGGLQAGRSPRYHARDVALVRAQRLGATAVLGSATPSLERYAKAPRAAPSRSSASGIAWTAGLSPGACR